MRQHVFLVGFMGSGKSTVGPPLAALLGLPFVDLDREVEEERGEPITEIFRTYGESAFRELERLCLERVSKGPPSVVAVGGGAFSSEENRVLMLRTGITVFLDVSLEAAWSRCAGDPTRPLAADFGRFERLFRQRRETYRLADIRIESGFGKPSRTSAEIASRLKALGVAGAWAKESD